MCQSYEGFNRDKLTRRIALLGSAKALKPKIIIETLIEMNLLPARELVLFTDEEEGQCVEYCRSVSMEVVVYSNSRLDDLQSESMAVKTGAGILVSIGWPRKIPLEFLGLFAYPPINCHGSVLPDYRGMRAYMHYWANCEEFYGATIHYMNENFDDGDIIIQGRLKLFPEETPEMLHRRTSELCAYLLPTALFLVESGYTGRRVGGMKRYFENLSPDEFRRYREYNQTRPPSDRILTPHRVVD